MTGTLHDADLHWELLMTAESDLQAEVIAGILKEAGIPVLRQSPTAGVFGYGFSAPTPQGIRLSVPSDLLEKARDIVEAEPGSTVV